MPENMTVKEAARLWNVADTWITAMCRAGRVPGAKKDGKAWLIPADAQKPADKRVRTGVYVKKTHSARLPLPVGISDYRLASSEYYYIDKTMMIRDFLDERPMVSLFTRPRRFGKTLNMDMLRTFFEKTGEDTSFYFRNKKIWACGPKYREHQGRYPVIFVTFKDVKCNTWPETYDFLAKILRREYERHSELAESEQLSETEKNDFENILENKYSEYFGFTPAEVKEMAEYYHAADRYDEICEWYDGYRFGRSEIFNPWSVINYFSNDCEPRAFWQSTGSNDIISEVVAEADAEIYEKLTSLVNGGSFTTLIDTGVIYPQIHGHPSTIYSFLLVAGYLKATKTDPAFNGDYMCEVSLPNKEISFVYHKEILQKLENIIPQSAAIAVQEAIYSGDGAKLQAQIQSLLTQSVSWHDTAGENFYHGFLLGLCALLGGSYVTSNRESGDGRYDIQLMPKNSRLPGILIELKAEKDCSAEQLKKLSETALQQIESKKYDTEMIAKGIGTIYKYGVAFCGKRVEVTVR